MQCVLNTVLICVIQSMSTEFTYCNHVLDGLILDRGGVVLDTKDSGIINVCSPCKSSLARKKIPRFALANGLYRGNLPHEFCDITHLIRPNQRFSMETHMLAVSSVLCLLVQENSNSISLEPHFKCEKLN